MEENFCLIAGLLQKLGSCICGQLEYQPETGNAAAGIKTNSQVAAEYNNDILSRSALTEVSRDEIGVESQSLQGAPCHAV